MRNFILSCAVLAALAVAAPDRTEAAGAMAIGKCNRNGYSYNHPSEGAAVSKALAECRANGDGTCEVVLRIHSSCGAFAVSGDNNCGARGWAYAASRGAAENLAISYCRSHGGVNCHIQAWVCDGGP